MSTEFRLEEQRIFSMHDGGFEALFKDVIIERAARNLKEPGQGFPMIEHIVECFAETELGSTCLLSNRSWIHLLRLSITGLLCRW